MPAGSNEKLFSELIKSKFGQILEGKRVFPNGGGDVTISVDNSIGYKNDLVLIEIDSGNMAKLLVGQYALLKSCYDDSRAPLMVIVHYYKDKKYGLYNSNRTTKNLNHIAKYIDGRAIPFVAFNAEEFKTFIKDCDSKEVLVAKLKEISAS